MLIVFLFSLILLVFSIINLVTSLFSFKPEKHPKTRKYPFVTIVVRTWDDGHIVERFIRHIFAQNYKGKIQLIIADDASRDNTGKICKKYRGKITYVRAKKHHEKKAEFLNKVIKKYAKGEILINTDIDAIMPTNWVKNLVSHFKKGVHAVCGPAYSGNYPNWLSKIRVIEDFWFFSSGMWARYNITGTAATYGSNHAIRMETLKKIGYYGTKTLTEDAELTIELWKRGYKIEMCPRAFVLVEAVSDTKSFIRERKRWIIGTLKTGMQIKKPFLPSFLFGVNVLAGFISMLGFFSLFPVLIFIINSVAIALSLLSFRAKSSFLFWVPVFMFAGTFLNMLAFFGALRDMFGKGVKWVKVEGKKYHIGVDLTPPLEL